MCHCMSFFFLSPFPFSPLSPHLLLSSLPSRPFVVLSFPLHAELIIYIVFSYSSCAAFGATQICIVDSKKGTLDSSCSTDTNCVSFFIFLSLSLPHLPLPTPPLSLCPYPPLPLSPYPPILNTTIPSFDSLKEISTIQRDVSMVDAIWVLKTRYTSLPLSRPLLSLLFSSRLFHSILVLFLFMSSLFLLI